MANKINKINHTNKHSVYTNACMYLQHYLCLYWCHRAQ